MYIVYIQMKNYQNTDKNNYNSDINTPLVLAITITHVAELTVLSLDNKLS